MASARILKWALTLSAYNYSIAYKPGANHSNADLLRRHPLSESVSNVPLPGETVLLMETLQGSPVTAAQLKAWTDKDPILSRVRNLVLKGWQEISHDSLHPYEQRKNELSIEDGCVLWGCRVVIPSVERETVLEELHAGHMGISRMKSLARGVVWRPGLDERESEDMEAMPGKSKSSVTAPTHPWEWPKRPWSRLNIDHAGPFEGRLFWVVADATS